MSRPGRLARRLWYLVNRRRLQAELMREMSAHRAQMTDPRDFGNALRLREESGDVWGWNWLDDLGRDLRYAGRQLRRAPKYALAVMSVLAAGSGAGLGVLHLANAAYFHSLSVLDAKRLVILSRSGEWHPTFSYVDAVFYREHARAFSYVVAESRGSVVSTGDDPRPLPVAFVSGNYFRDLRLVPALGRLLVDVDARRGASPVCVLGNQYWRRELGEDPSIVGRIIRVNQTPVEVVGIAPSTFDGLAAPGTAPVGLWLPMELRPLIVENSAPLDDITRTDTAVFGALKTGVTLAAASAEIEALTVELSAHRAVPSAPVPFGTVGVIPLIRPPRFEGDVAFLFVLVGLIFVSACANLGTISIARGFGRRREFEVRLALGASAGRLVRQLITEHALLALLASAVGSAAGYVAGQFLRSISDDLPPGLQIAFDLRMAVVSSLAGLTAVVGFGILPALKMLRRSTAVARGRRGFVAVQVAASCVLLVLSALLWRGSQRLNAFEPSFDFRRMIVVDPQLRARDFDVSKERAILEAMASRVREIASISSVAIGTEGSVVQSQSMPPMLSFEIGPTYLETLGLAVVRGRGFYAGEGDAAIISESAARALWPDRDALGQTLTISKQSATRTIVGIVHDSGLSVIGNRGVGEVYIPLSDGKLNRAVLIAHARAEPGALLREVRDAAALTGVTPTAALFRLSNRSASSGPRLMTFLALIATVLAFLGVFGQVAFAVAQRTREIGIRMAIGATPRDVLSELMLQQARPLVVGLSIGAFLAAVGARAMNAELYGLSPLDPTSLTLGLGGFAIVAAIAIVLPGRRALRVDPAVTLRAE